MNIPAMKALAKHLPNYMMGKNPRNPLRMYDEKVKDFGYSVLGVMVDIYRRATKQGKWIDTIGELSRFVLFNGEPWVMGVPPEIAEWYGLNELQVNNYWLLQMDGATFKQIARGIEIRIEKEEGKRK